MKITAQAGSGETLVTVDLASGVAARVLPAGLEWTRAPLAQSEPLVRSDRKFVKDRGNVERSVIFSVGIQQATLAAADAFCMVHDLAISGLNALGPVQCNFIAEDAAGHSFALADCIIKFTVKPEGLNTTTVYSITGSALSDTTPPPAP